MREKILAIAITLPLLILAGVGSMAGARHVSEIGQRMTEQIEERLRAAEPQAALETARQLEEKWSEWEPVLQLWVCHADTDEVSKKLLLVIAGLENENRHLVTENTALLKEAFAHLHHRDDLSLSNVF